MNAQIKSKKTTGAAIGAILVAVGHLVTALFDGDPATAPDYTVVIASLVAAYGLWSARDADVTSEQSGAKVNGAP